MGMAEIEEGLRRRLGLPQEPSRQAAIRQYLPQSVADPVVDISSEMLRYAPLAMGPYGKYGPPPVLPKQPYVPNPNARYTLSENFISDPYTPNSFAYDILDRGSPVGKVGGDVRGHTANINWIGRSRAGSDLDANMMRPLPPEATIFDNPLPLPPAPVRANTMGPAAMRFLRDEFRRDFPDVVTFTGHRISGARASDKAMRDARGVLQNMPRQTVIIP